MKERALSAKWTKVSGGVQVTRRREPVGVEADAHELVGFVVRQVTEEDAVHDGADADRGAEPDAEGRDDAGGERRRAPDATQGVPRVAREVVDRDDTARVLSPRASAAAAEAE